MGESEVDMIIPATPWRDSRDALNILFEARRRVMDEASFWVIAFARYKKPMRILRNAQRYICESRGCKDHPFK